MVLTDKQVIFFVFANNKISDADQLSRLLQVHGDVLQNFDIYSNQLTAIPNISFITKISVLDFSNNHIFYTNSGSLQPDLGELILSNNYLPFIPRIMNNLNFLSNLDMSSNHVTATWATNIPVSVVGVSLNENLITELTDTSFPQNSSILDLNLNNNPLYKISPNAFQNLAKLSNLHLQYTKLTPLPVAIAALSSLDFLDLRRSDDLMCTCMEKSLEFRISSLKSFTVFGECGYMNIYDFFTQFSQDLP